MAVLLRNSGRRLVAYLPDFKSAVRHFRAFSSYDERKEDYVYVSAGDMNQSAISWPDKNLGPLNPEDKKFPLPGHVGVTPSVVKPPLQFPPNMIETDLLTGPLPHEHQVSSLESFNEGHAEMERDEESLTSHSSLHMLECALHDCPDILRKDLQDLFPGHDLAQGNLTVITLSQRTDNDMTAWNPEVDEEREVLLEQFVSASNEICSSLHHSGYWADFIDPSSGRPYLGAFTNATLFETDERYRHFGFEITDLGCCKVIAHHKWGTHAYVGSIFTDAPLNHPVLLEMCQQESVFD